MSDWTCTLSASVGSHFPWSGLPHSCAGRPPIGVMWCPGGRRSGPRHDRHVGPRRVARIRRREAGYRIRFHRRRPPSAMLERGRPELRHQLHQPPPAQPLTTCDPSSRTTREMPLSSVRFLWGCNPRPRPEGLRPRTPHRGHVGIPGMRPRLVVAGASFRWARCIRGYREPPRQCHVFWGCNR
jgi:hypothetical protein